MTLTAKIMNMRSTNESVSVIMTVRNDADGCAVTLDSLLAQTHPPNEIVVVDGGSTDDTLSTIRAYAARDSRVRLIEAPGANIARGRNIATEHATGTIIATTDAGCRADADWLVNLLRPFAENADTGFVAGFYRADPHSLLEEVVGLATMRGQLDPVDAETFNPSARSMAYRKDVWRRAGGWPEWIRFSEDTLFDHKIRRMDVAWRFAGDAIVHWRPRSSVLGIARQFFFYGTGRGHTQIDAPSFRYNIRNLFIVLCGGAASAITPWAVPLTVFAMFYFYVWTFHKLARRVATRTERPVAYILCLLVMWIVLFANLTGYIMGSWQRWRDHERYAERMGGYLAPS